MLNYLVTRRSTCLTHLLYLLLIGPSIRCSSTSPRSSAPPPSTSHSRPTGRRPGCAHTELRPQPCSMPAPLLPCLSSYRPSLPRRTRCGAGAAQTAELQRHSTYTEADLQVCTARYVWSTRYVIYTMPYSPYEHAHAHRYYALVYGTTGVRERHARHPRGCGDPEPAVRAQEVRSSRVRLR